MTPSPAISLGVLFLLLLSAGCGSGTRPQQGGGVPPGGGAPPGSISITPTTVTAGSPDVTLIVTGSAFTHSVHDLSRVCWSVGGNTEFLATTFVSSSELTATIPAALLSTPVVASVFVETGDPKADIRWKSNSVDFKVTTSVAPPVITSVSPTNAVAGSPDLILTIAGANFTAGDRYFTIVNWSANGLDTSLPFTMTDSTKLTATVPAELLGKPTSAAISVQTWYWQNDVPTFVSNSVSFSVTSNQNSTHQTD